MNGNWIFHNSHDLLYREPFGAVPEDTLITLRLAVQAAAAARSVILRIWNDGYEQKVPMALYRKDSLSLLYQAVFVSPSKPGLVWYYFIITTEDGVYYYCNNEEQYGGIGRVYTEPKGSYQITVYKEGYHTPDWFKGANMYQIFVDRFNRGIEYKDQSICRDDAYIHRSWYEKPCCTKHPDHSGILCNDFFGGDLQGVIDKLPYLHSLGISVIYLNPIFESPSNHKYDTSDYKKIDPMFGDEELFERLCREAGNYGIRVILDGVFSHTGSDSVYFNRNGRYSSQGAYQSKESPYYSWYRFYQYPTKYDCWWGIDTLPNVNEQEPSYQNFILFDDDSVVRRWLRKGASGWRLDVVDELPDEFLKKLRTVVKGENPDYVVIGEVWEDASNKFSYGKMREFLWGEELDSAMNYPFRKLLLSFILGESDADTLNKGLMSQFENYPKEAFYSMMNLIGSHDVTRVMTLLEEAPSEEQISKEEQSNFTPSDAQRMLGRARLMLIALLQLTLPGVPCTYYGDEAGLEGHRDPFNRRPYPWGHEDQALLAYNKILGNFRRSSSAVKTGEWHPLYHEGDVYAFCRCITEETDVFGKPCSNCFTLSGVNRSLNTWHSVSLDIGAYCGEAVLFDIVNEGREVKVVDGLLRLTIAPLTGFLLSTK